MKKIGIMIVTILLLSSVYTVMGIQTNEPLTKVIIREQATSNAGIIIDISAQEAWDLIVDPNSGIENPIDMRRLDEYVNERIELPNDKNPTWFPYELTSDGPGPIKNEGVLLKLFINIYQGKDILIYCRTGRRTGLAAQILIENGFEGTIYNMDDGITEWKTIGLPTSQGFP